MKIIKKVNILCLILVAFFLTVEGHALAESAGGQVSTTSGITFLKEKEVPTKPTTPTSPTEPAKVTAGTKTSFLPKTGEILTEYKFLILGFIALAVLGVIFLKRSRKYE